MIQRADFASLGADEVSAQNIASMSIEQLQNEGILVHMLRKPDFQRETNHWDVDQYIKFLKSYLDNELVPSVILWKSPSHIFVIDGGHRISALRAWVEDDYGAGYMSQKFYGNNISEEQKKIAARVKRKVDSEIGSFKTLKEISRSVDGDYDPLQKKRAANISTRTLSLQWVEGNSSVAETSFFKINTQGTPLDKIEERLLRNRNKPIAICARSIIRAGSGHKYWSKFEKNMQHEIEKKSEEINRMLFQPEINEPIKTLDLPLGGKTSPIAAMNLLMDFIEVSNNEINEVKKDSWLINQVDESGEATLTTLTKCHKLLGKVTGNHSGSLGLHPAIYFYNNKGKHNSQLFLAIMSLCADVIQNNNTSYFRKFSKVRGRLERYLIINKAIINQAISQIYSNKRVINLRKMFEGLIESFYLEEEVTVDALLGYLELKGKLVASELESSAAKDFSKDAKSEIYLKASLEAALQCPICEGYIDNTKSASYDHVQRKQDGGLGGVANGQITHPYCNSAIKN